MISDYSYIRTCLKEIEIKINLGDSSNWTDPEFRKLSKEIEKITHVNISAQTLKRYYGKIHYKTKFNPQGATKDALAAYLGYKDWDHYKSIKGTQVKKSTSKFLIPFCISAILVLLFGLFKILNVRKQTEASPLISFKTQNKVGYAPLSIMAEYELKDKIKDSLFLDLGYIHKVQGYQRLLIDPSKKQINHCFQEPGYYRISVTRGRKTLARDRIHVLSKGWTYNVMLDMKASPEELVANSFIGYQLNDSLLSEGTGILYIPPETVYGLGADKQYDYKLRFLLYKEFGISGDSCIFEFRYKNSTEDGGISCFDTMIAIISENGQIYLNTMDPGCFAWAYLTVSNIELDGHFTDLSPLCMDMNSWTNMKIKVKDMEAMIYFNEELVYRVPYTQALGEIKGLRFGFKGSGKADYIRLSDSEENLVFSDEFVKENCNSGV